MLEAVIDGVEGGRERAVLAGHPIQGLLVIDHDGRAVRAQDEAHGVEAVGLASDHQHGVEPLEDLEAARAVVVSQVVARPEG